MKRIAGLILILLAAFACGVGLYISAVNREPVVLDLLFFPQVTLRSGMVVILSFVAGALAGLLAGSLAGTRRPPAERWPATRIGRDAR